MFTFDRKIPPTWGENLKYECIYCHKETVFWALFDTLRHTKVFKVKCKNCELVSSVSATITFPSPTFTIQADNKELVSLEDFDIWEYGDTGIFIHCSFSKREDLDLIKNEKQPVLMRCVFSGSIGNDDRVDFNTFFKLKKIDVRNVPIYLKFLDVLKILQIEVKFCLIYISSTIFFNICSNHKNMRCLAHFWIKSKTKFILNKGSSLLQT